MTKPLKTDKNIVTLSMDPALLAVLREVARAEHTSVRGLALKLLEERVREKYTGEMGGPV